MKNKTAIFLLTLYAILITVTTGCPHEAKVLHDSVKRSEIIQPEEKTYWNGTIESDFDGSSVIVVMDKFVGGINK